MGAFLCDWHSLGPEVESICRIIRCVVDLTYPFWRCENRVFLFPSVVQVYIHLFTEIAVQLPCQPIILVGMVFI